MSVQSFASDAASVASADFNISQRTEAEVEAILQHLTNQNALMLEILRRRGAGAERQPC